MSLLYLEFHIQFLNLGKTERKNHKTQRVFIWKEIIYKLLILFKKKSNCYYYSYSTTNYLQKKK